MQYISSLKNAIFIFPFVSILLIIPFLIVCYRKYGSVSFFRTIILFSFFFYLLCCYFLVVFPLPSISVVSSYTKPYYNLKLFYFIPDFLMNDSFDFKNINTYSLIIRNSKYFEAICNVFMIIPFGVYLRYYFKCSFFKTVFYSFLLSLFFELTQLTGLYFIYPRPYRLFDVNDLINNSLGGFIGYIICPCFSFFLPRRDVIDSNDYLKGNSVSFGRRFVSVFIDYFIIFVCTFFICYVFNFKYFIWIYIFLNFVYFNFIYFFFEGFTFGKWFVNYKTVSSGLSGSLSLFRIFIKWLILHAFILNGWVYIFLYYYYINQNIYYLLVLYICFFVLFIIYVFMCSIFNKKIFYDLFLKLDSVSINEWLDYDEI